MKMARKINILAWGLSLIVLILAFVVWAQGMAWDFNRISTYRLFPLLGLIAYSLMWAHYIMGAARRYMRVDKTALARYFEITSAIVLVAILLHPNLLIWQLWRDGLGVPPHSYIQAYGEANQLPLLLGSISLMVFLAYELRRKFATSPWWKFVVYAGDAAMLAIFYHALRLGTHTQSGWYRTVWLTYGVTYVLVLIYTRRYDFISKKELT